MFDWTSVVVGSTFCWITWVIFSFVRRIAIARINAGVQEKLLQRIDSSESLLALAASDSGRSFLESITVDRSQPDSPFTRILFGVQAGIVLVFFGFAMLFLHHHTVDERAGFMIFGIGAIGLGLGFLFAAAASILVSRRLGLLDRDRRG